MRLVLEVPHDLVPRRAEGLTPGQAVANVPPDSLGHALDGRLADVQAGELGQGDAAGLGEAGEQTASEAAAVRVSAERPSTRSQGATPPRQCGQW